MEGILVPISLFAMIAAIVIVPKYLRSRERQRLLDTLRTAYDRGQPVPPDLIDSLMTSDIKAPSPDRDLRSGVTLIAVALAFVVLGLAIENFTGDEHAMIFAAIGAFPGFVGVGQLALWFARRRTGL